MNQITIVTRRELKEKLKLSIPAIIDMERKGMPVIDLGWKRYVLELVEEWIADKSRLANDFS